MLLVSSIQIPHTLVACGAPVVEESFHDFGVFEHDVVHVTVCLTVKCNSRGLAFGTDAFGPWRMLTTAGLDATVDIVEDKVFALAHARGLLSDVRVEGQVLDVLLLQVGLVIGLQGGAVDTTTVRVVVAAER